MNVVLLGPPGAGKGTQAAKLAERFGLAHISTGDILRGNVREGTPLGLRAKAYMDRGELVPDQLVIDLVMDRIGQPDSEKGFVLDGFPRTVAQADALNQALAERGRAIDVVVDIRVPEDELVRRLSSRYSCRACGAVYSVLSNPSLADMPCRACGGELYQRDDDTPETVRKRFKVYEEQTKPLVDYYKKQDRLIEADGSKSVVEVALSIASLVRQSV